MIHFIVGTRAQLFKMAPIMLECERLKLTWRWVYTAQHKETIEQTLQTFGLPQPAYTIVNWNTEAKTMGKIWLWFLKMLWAIPRSKKILGGYTGKSHIVLTHGDTLTTWLAAVMARLTRTRVMHVESGLRSFNIWKPFPEEINRLITFRLSQYYACPGEWALNNLSKYSGVKFNTYQNTQMDVLKFGLQHADSSKLELPKGKYAVVSIHRYENIFKEDRFLEIIDRLEEVAHKFELVFVQHPATKLQLEKYKLVERLQDNKSISLLPRLEYLDFIKVVKHSEFVITDGGGNQEELYHLGKPTLIFRDETERQEGLGETAVISRLDPAIIEDFIKNYKQYERETKTNGESPAKIIVSELVKAGYGEE
jgi:UDP-N-acetylglucosamine 2-epimerase (non-hydrolysing)